MNRKQLICIIIGSIVLATIIAYGFLGDIENSKFHFNTIQVKGVVCPNNQDFGYIQDTNDVIYNIPIEQCKVQPVGQVIDISYHHIHNPYAISNEWDFNTIVVGGL